jgi:tetratricopeptide (TPR) repeat protein
MNVRSSQAPFPLRRLDSWKSIANYLGRSTRTVQRWHAIYGLPIYRLGSDKSSIFTYADKLDEWMRCQGQALADEPTKTDNSVLLSFPATHSEPISHNQPSVSSHTHGTEKARSAEFVAIALRMSETTSVNNIRNITQHFREAIDLDPDNAEAFAGMSSALLAGGLWGLVPAPVAYSAAQTAMQKALEIDAAQLEAKCTAAWLDMVLTRNWQRARSTFDDVLAVHVHPIFTYALIGRAMLQVAEGNLQESFKLLRNASQQDPLCLIAEALCCWCAYLAGQFAEALDLADEVRACGGCGPILCAVEALASIQHEEPDVSIRRIKTMIMDFPQYSVLQGTLGYALAVNGESEKAANILNSLAHAGMYGRNHSHYAIALTQIGMGHKQEAAEQLELSYRDGSFWSLGFQSDPIVAQLRNDPHFLQFLNKVSYPIP